MQAQKQRQRQDEMKRYYHHLSTKTSIKKDFIPSFYKAYRKHVQQQAKPSITVREPESEGERYFMSAFCNEIQKFASAKDSTVSFYAKDSVPDLADKAYPFQYLTLIFPYYIPIVIPALHEPLYVNSIMLSYVMFDGSEEDIGKYDTIEKIIKHGYFDGPGMPKAVYDALLYYYNQSGQIQRQESSQTTDDSPSMHNYHVQYRNMFKKQDMTGTTQMTKKAQLLMSPFFAAYEERIEPCFISEMVLFHRTGVHRIKQNDALVNIYVKYMEAEDDQRPPSPSQWDLIKEIIEHSMMIMSYVSGINPYTKFLLRDSQKILFEGNSTLFFAYTDKSIWANQYHQAELRLSITHFYRGVIDRVFISWIMRLITSSLFPRQKKKRPLSTLFQKQQQALLQQSAIVQHQSRPFRILELSCGFGHFIYKFILNLIVNTDIRNMRPIEIFLTEEQSLAMGSTRSNIARLQEQYPSLFGSKFQVHFIEGDATATIPILDRSIKFDVIISQGSLLSTAIESQSKQIDLFVHLMTYRLHIKKKSFLVHTGVEEFFLPVYFMTRYFDVDMEMFPGILSYNAITPQKFLKITNK